MISLRLFVLGILLFSQLGITPTRAASPTPATGRAETVLLDRSDQAGLAELSAAGALKLADYGAFSLWQLPAPPVRASATLARLPRAGSRINLRGLVIDGAAAQPEPALPANLMASPQANADEQFWLVQFAGPLQDTWLDQLRSAGQVVAACMPDYACVLWGASPVQAIDGLGGLVRWQGAFHPAYRLHPDLRPGGMLRAAGGELEVTVQVLDVPAGQAALQTLAGLAVSEPALAHKVTNLLDVQARIRVDQLDRLASLPAVFNIEPFSPPQKNDEMQAQILGGNITNTAGNVTASGPGYLTFLQSLHVSSNPGDYPILDIVDDGIDTGDVTNILHPDFKAYPNGVQAPYSRIQFLNSCLSDHSTDGADGHGNLNAGIATGYNGDVFKFNLFLPVVKKSSSIGAVQKSYLDAHAGDNSGTSNAPEFNSSQQFNSKVLDSEGYSFGMGVSPYGRLAGTKVFGDSGFDWSACGNSYTGIVRQAYNAGARITSNSWGGDNGAYYDAAAQEYDQLTRDADPTTAGNQEMLHVFSAGNKGSSPNTVGTPGTAKNVIAVGASDLPRDVGIFDGCLRSSSASADNIASYSSRGPTQDGRAKPDLVAPGTHIQGPASQDPAYNGLGICGASGPDKRYYPTGQTLYTWSTGTSHAAPAVAGAAQLAWERYVAAQGVPPSPAMLKAMLLNNPRYLNGVSSGDTLPSSSQGWGMPDLAKTFDDTPRAYYDQHHIFGNSGETYTLSGTIPDPTKPFHVTLVWTDAPGSIVGQALVNDLDLEVRINGAADPYRGNVFNGANSAMDVSGGSGGSADTLNNVENVYLPAGGGTTFEIKVIARNIAGDGVPNNIDFTDQDFALVISNAKVPPQPILSIVGVEWQKEPGSINLNGPLEPGQSAALRVKLGNSADGVKATSIQATLLVISGQATVSPDSSAYPNLATGAQANNLTDFQVTLSPIQACGGLLQLQLSLVYSFNGGSSHGSAILPLPAVLTARQRIQTYSYPGAAVIIPDKPPGTGQNPPTLVAIPVSFPYPVRHLSVTLSINHPRPADLQFWLKNESGTTILLANKRGGNALGFSNLTFDDDAAVSIATIGNPPSTQALSGKFRPETPLASLIDNNPPTGTWTLQVLDTQNNTFSGLLTAASINATYQLCGVVDPPPRLSIRSLAWQEVPGKSNLNGVLEAGEEATLEVTLQNENTSTVARNLTVQLEALSGQIAVDQANSTYPTIGDGVSGINHDLFQASVLSTSACGQDLPFQLQASFSYDNGSGLIPGSQTILNVCMKTWLPMLKRFSP